MPNTNFPSTEELQYLWDEYKYRHDLCWRTVYRASFAVVFLAAIPYVRLDLAKALNFWMIIPTGLGVFVAVLSIFVVSNELERFGIIKDSYRELQNLFWSQIKNHDKEKKFINDRDFSESKATNFRSYVKLSLVGLLLFSIANCWFLLMKWLPYVRQISA
jgi:uncharacterized membrane protein YjgN (DUF898 family)